MPYDQQPQTTTQTKTYNPFNQLITVTTDTMTTTYTHRADGLRHSKTVNGNTLIHAWDRGNIVFEYRETGSLFPIVINRFNRANGQLVSSQHHGVYLHNARGDVVQRVDVNGNVLYTYRFDAFGNQLLPNDMPDHNPLTATQNTTNTNPFRFAGEYLDFETGNIYLRARYFNPRTGRFTQEDPHWNIGNMQSGTLAILQSSNLYAGMLNNPIRWIDPSGRSVIPAFILVAGPPMFVPPRGLMSMWLGEAAMSSLGSLLGRRAPLDDVGIQTIIDAIQPLTNHTIGFRHGVFAITRRAPTYERTLPYGNRLVQRALAHTGHTVEFQVIPHIGNAHVLLGRNHSIINFDPYATLDGRPPYIGMAHELIHLVQAKRNRFDDFGREHVRWVVSSVDSMMQPFSIVDYVPRVELAAIGLAYYRSNDITENMIRAEHGIGLRPAYFGWDRWGYFRP